ncbi:hypothetical protein H0H81_008592 [Sphagnurus paluster]|uniref:Uncharacterized protein n=1 Tax=Sphagnurus paluster TaxID=117069 RepID=A0A9P7GK22_9AGAR|nr:hypothetical protein H0H81_008592 [Sphagnurus paluster]
MPHKRAKRSVRENERKKRGDDLAPTNDSLSNEPIPKALSRVLNAAKVREEWKIKKRKLEEDGDSKSSDKRRKLDDDEKNTKSKRKESKATSKLTIKPGESIQHFNRRVEDDMRPLVKAAVQTSNATVRSAAKAEKEAKAAKKQKGKSVKEDLDDADSKPLAAPTPVTGADKHASKAKEFQKVSTSAPRRLNDIAQAPPEFKKLPRGAAPSASERGSGGKRDGILSMAQKAMMERERENAIARYRELKARQRKSGEKSDERDRDAVDED